MNVYHTCAGARKKTGEGIRSSWVGVVDGCELPGRGPENQSPQEEEGGHALNLWAPFYKSLTFQHKLFGIAMECFYS